MSGKRLLPLAALFVILVIAAVILKRPQTPTSLVEEAAFERLVPPTMRADAITGIDVYQGTQPEAGVRLRSKDGKWTVASHFDAPGNTTKIQDFLKQVSSLQGELRADSATLHGDFSIEESQAMHLLVYTDTTDKPAVHLLAGRGKGSNGFLRRDGEDRVYTVDVNLHTVAGLYGDNASQPPPAKPWLELHIQNVPNEQVSSVDLHTPEQHLRFTLPPAPATPAADSPTPPTAASLWSLAAPTWPYPVKQEAVEGLVSTLRTLQAEDIADPAKLSEYGLQAATYRAILTVQPSDQEARQVPLLVGNEVPEQEGKRYARLGQEGPVYILASSIWQRLFPALGSVLTAHVFPGLSVDEVMHLSVQHADQSWSLERQLPGMSAASSGTEEAPVWVLSHDPQVNVDAEVVTRLWETAAQLMAEDILAIPATELDPPLIKLRLTWHDGRTEQVEVGKFSGKDDPSYYVKRQNALHMFVVPTQAYEKLEAALSAVHSPQ